MDLLLNKNMRKLATASDGAPSPEDIALMRKVPSIEFVNLKNAVLCDEAAIAQCERTFDTENLSPVAQRHFSPFMASIGLLRDLPRFQRDQGIRYEATERFMQQIMDLRIHLENKSWTLFDKQFRSLEIDADIRTAPERVEAVFKATELATMFFRPFSDSNKRRVCQRIALAQSTSPQGMSDLVRYFQTRNKVQSLDNELWSIRGRWRHAYGILAPIYMAMYWDEKKHSLDDYTLDQKRFDELKPLYVDGFETFSRMSVIAAGLEGIIAHGQAGVPSKKRLLTMEEFDLTPNGAKPDVLKGLPIGDVFTPYMDHNLRNGLGHHSAHYEVTDDSIHYVTENAKGRKEHRITYIRFCEKLVSLYSQVEIVASYSHWLSKSVLGIKWSPS